MGFLDGKRTVRHYDTARRQAKTDFAAGRELLDASVRGMDDLDAELYGQVRRGGLTPAMEREFEVQQGRLGDLVARDRRSMGADLLQATRRSGGTLDANTALAYQVEREGQLDEARFDASNDIAFRRAGAMMERTDRLYQMIASLRERKGALSQAERDRAAQMWLGTIGGAAGYKTNVLAAGTGAATSTMGAGVTGQGYGYYQGEKKGGW